MIGHFSRRQFIMASAAAAAGPAVSRIAQAQDPGLYAGRSTVALTSGEDRARNIYNALDAIHDQIQPVLSTKKSVLIKPNVVVSDNPVSVTHLDALRGILEYLRSRAQFKGPVVIAEASAVSTLEAFDNNHYFQIAKDFTGVSLVDLNEEGLYVIHAAIDKDLHAQPVRLAARLFDPDAFIICSAVMKTHDRVVATLSVKNLAMGSPLHATLKEGWWSWSDKPKMHDTYRLANVNIFQVAQRLKQYWGVAVIDGYEGMEGNGPSWGTPVPSRLAIASTDFVAADRVGVELMGIDPSWVGYLNYAWRLGLGQFDLSKIDVQGASTSSLKRSYKLHQAVGDELQWLQPFPGCDPGRQRAWRHL